MAKMLRLTDTDVANAVRASASGSRSATLLRSGLEIVIRSGGSVSLDYLDRAIDSLVDYFISSSEAAKCQRYFSALYDEQQQDAAA